MSKLLLFIAGAIAGESTRRAGWVILAAARVEAIAFTIRSTIQRREMVNRAHAEAIADLWDAEKLARAALSRGQGNPWLP